MNKTLLKSESPVSRWAGGKTTELYIYPESSSYSKGDFLFRISTADVELEESDFTILPDYDRLIASISGEMRLSHGNGVPPCHVLPMRNVYAFDGGAGTHCAGKCCDINLMLRKGECSGRICFANAGDKLSFTLGAGDFAAVYLPSGGKTVIMSNGSFGLTISEKAAVFTISLLQKARP